MPGAAAISAATTAFAPSAEKRATSAAPMPRAAPVTTTILRRDGSLHRAPEASHAG